jgi:hypothetical protein
LGNTIFPEDDTLLFYDSKNSAELKSTTNIRAKTITHTVFAVEGSIGASETTLILSNPNNQVTAGDLLETNNLNKPLYVTKKVSTSTFIVNETPGVDISLQSFTVRKRNTIPTMLVTVNSGTYFKKGFIIKCQTQSLVPDKYNAYPFKSVGLDLVEELVSANDDPSLLDPALGSSNYLGEGADRLKLTLILNSYDVNDDGFPDVTINYVELFRMANGVEDRFDSKTSLTTLRQELADRTYDESGNYTVNPITFEPIVTSFISKYINVRLAPLKAYIGGYAIETTTPTVIPIEKEFSTETIEGHNITNRQGNYVIVKDVTKGFPNTYEISQNTLAVEIHSSFTPSQSTILGTLAVRSLEYLEGSGSSTKFKLSTYITSFNPGADAATAKTLIGVRNYITAAPVESWEAWVAKYTLPRVDAETLVPILFGAGLLGNFDGVNYYGLNRAPDAELLAWATSRYITTYSRNASSQFKSDFVTHIRTNYLNTDDYTRILTAVKTYLPATTASPFYSSIILTDYTEANTFFKANIELLGTGLTGTGQAAGLPFEVYDQQDLNPLIFPLDYTAVQTVSNINTTANKMVREATFSAGQYTISFAATAPESFPFGNGALSKSQMISNFQIMVKTSASANTTVGLFDFNTKGSVTISNNGKTAVISLADTAFNGKADINYTIETDGLSYRSKTVVNNQTKTLQIVAPGVEHSLNKTDIAKFTGVFKLGSNTFIGDYNSSNTYAKNNAVQYNGGIYVANAASTGKTVLDPLYWTKVYPEGTLDYIYNDGQRDAWYDFGSITFIGELQNAPQNVVVVFDYYNHSGEGPLTAQSYPDRFKIPVFRSTISSREYNLRNCLDFRPRRRDTGPSLVYDFDSFIKPNMNALVEADITYYLSRYDRIYMSNRTRSVDGKYTKIWRDSGKPNLNPVKPVSLENRDNLLLGTVYVPPPINAINTVICIPELTQRKTMKDINFIDKRLTDVERKIKLHDIELAKIRRTLYNEEGDQLYKSGIFVDAFTDLLKIDKSKYTVGVYVGGGVCRPTIGAYSLRFDFPTDPDIQVTGPYVTMKYSEEVFASQLFITGESTEVNPGGVNDNTGRATITPNNSLSITFSVTGSAITVGPTLVKQTAEQTGVTPDKVVNNPDIVVNPVTTTTTTSTDTTLPANYDELFQVDPNGSQVTTIITDGAKQNQQNNNNSDIVFVGIVKDNRGQSIDVVGKGIVAVAELAEAARGFNNNGLTKENLPGKAEGDTSGKGNELSPIFVQQPKEDFETGLKKAIDEINNNTNDLLKVGDNNVDAKSVADKNFALNDDSDPYGSWGTYFGSGVAATDANDAGGRASQGAIVIVTAKREGEGEFIQVIDSFGNAVNTEYGPATSGGGIVEGSDDKITATDYDQVTPDKTSLIEGTAILAINTTADFLAFNEKGNEYEGMDRGNYDGSFFGSGYLSA